MVVNLQSGHEIALQYNQREITPKISKAELWFLCMTHRLNVLYNCMKFHLNYFMVVNLQSGHEIALQMIKGK